MYCKLISHVEPIRDGRMEFNYTVIVYLWILMEHEMLVRRNQDNGIESFLEFCI